VKPAVSAPQLTAGAALLLVAAAIWPWVAPAGAPRNTASTEGAAPPPPLRMLPPLTALSAIAERPLFSPTRRPNAPAAAPVETSQPGRYRLLGVIGVGNSRRALVVDGSRRIEISEGGALDTWTVKRIEIDRVVLATPHGETVLSVQRAGPEAAPAAPH